MCSGQILSKDIDEAWEYLDSLSENSQVWKTEDISKYNPPIATP